MQAKWKNKIGYLQLTEKPGTRVVRFDTDEREETQEKTVSTNKGHFRLRDNKVGPSGIAECLNAAWLYHIYLHGILYLYHGQQEDGVYVITCLYWLETV